MERQVVTLSNRAITRIAWSTAARRATKTLLAAVVGFAIPTAIGAWLVFALNAVAGGWHWAAATIGAVTTIAMIPCCRGLIALDDQHRERLSEAHIPAARVIGRRR